MKKWEKYNITDENMEEYIHKLEVFLKNKRILTLFEKSYKEYSYFGNQLIYTALEIPNARLLLQGFDWEATYEGFNFWNKINSEWLEHIGIFKSNFTLNEYSKAQEKLLVFKELLKKLDATTLFEENFNICNELHYEFIDDLLIRTFIAGYGYAEILLVWLDCRQSTPLFDELETIDDIERQLKNSPKYRVKALMKVSRGLNA